jgi:hypothetical protein
VLHYRRCGYGKKSNNDSLVETTTLRETRKLQAWLGAKKRVAQDRALETILSKAEVLVMEGSCSGFGCKTLVVMKPCTMDSISCTSVRQRKSDMTSSKKRKRQAITQGNNKPRYWQATTKEVEVTTTKEVEATTTKEVEKDITDVASAAAEGSEDEPYTEQR